MNRRLPAVAAALVLLGSSNGAGVSAPDARVEIVLDVSGSMAARIDGQVKMESARRAVLAAIDALEAGIASGEGAGGRRVMTALRLYGHRLPREPKAASCEDTELVIPFRPLDRARFMQTLKDATPKGQTPIARSLGAAAADLGTAGEGPAIVILVSDGEETCGGDPVAVACGLKQKGLEVTIHAVGFDVGEEAKRQLEGVAECTGGEYRDASNADELGRTLTDLTVASLLVDKERETRGQPIRGGDGFADAVPLRAGTRYHLDHHQRKNQFDYFRIEVGSGQKIVATIHTGSVGVDVRAEAARENKYPYAGISIHAPDQTRVAEQSIIGKPDGQAEVWASVPQGREGLFYLLVGSRYGNQHLNSPFEIELVDRFDADAGRDAGADDRTAVEIEPGEHRGWLQQGDREDAYTFQARGAATYAVEVRPVQAARLALALMDADRVEVAKARAPNPGAAVRIEKFTPDADGTYSIRLSPLRSIQNVEEVEYSLQLTADGGEAVASGTGSDPGDPAAAAEARRSAEGSGADPRRGREASGASGAEVRGGLSPLLMTVGVLALGLLIAGGILVRRRKG